MTFINEYTTYCAICGGPIEDLDVNPGWLSQVVLLHSSTELLSTKIQELPAKNTGGPYFELLSNLAAVTACDKSSSIVPSPRPLYIACHKQCVSLATRCMISQETTSHRSVSESMQHLWLVLVNLLEKASQDKIGPICNIYNAQAYGDIWRFQELVWQPSDDTETRFDSMHFEADPEDLPDLTEKILSHLQPIHISKFRARPEEPSEIPPNALEMAYTRHISPDTWRKALTDSYLPWLWDLEWSAIACKEASKPPEHLWDWEQLIRQLAQVDLHEPKAVFEDLPMGLRNRRRIWRIVDDILSQDVDSYYASQWQK